MPRQPITLLVAALALGCGKADAPHASPAAVSNPRREAELTTVTLTPDAERRLGIETAETERRVMSRVRTMGGEIVAAPGRTLMVSAPLAGTLAPPADGRVRLAGERVNAGQAVFRLVILPGDRDLARAQEDVDLAATRAGLARARADRAHELRQRDLMSVQDEEDARGAATEADAVYRAAQSRLRALGAAQDSGASALTLSAPAAGVLRQVHATPGQTVAAGAVLFEVVGTDSTWVRVPVYAGDVAAVARGVRASVRDLAANTGRAQTGRPVTGPPTADLELASVDLYYALDGGSWRPGQRVAVDVPLRGTASQLVVPWSAVVFDASGGAWVYQRTGERIYSRRRVELAWVSGNLAVLSRGPEPGATVVTAGAAELFGTEFGGGK